MLYAFDHKPGHYNWIMLCWDLPVIIFLLATYEHVFERDPYLNSYLAKFNFCSNTCYSGLPDVKNFLFFFVKDMHAFDSIKVKIFVDFHVHLLCAGQGFPEVYVRLKIF